MTMYSSACVCIQDLCSKLQDFEIAFLDSIHGSETNLASRRNERVRLRTRLTTCALARSLKCYAVDSNWASELQSWHLTHTRAQSDVSRRLSFGLKVIYQPLGDSIICLHLH